MIPYDAIKIAQSYDHTIRFSNRHKPKLAAKYLAPQKYSRKKLYDAMFAGKTVLFSNYPMRSYKTFSEASVDTLIRILKRGLPLKEKIYIRSGPSRARFRVTIQEAIARWVRQKSVFGVTDLHFRGTKFYDNVDAHSISYFNLLPTFNDDVSFLEMLTLVLSARGIVSDSHTDDGDGSNHCFVGRKLWMAWDRVEGQANGLQDCTIVPVFDQASFDMNAFLSLESAHWFTVCDNQTLFMPGNFTHKVLTLEPYIGFGSFYVALPGYLRTLKRWILRETTDVNPDFLVRMTQQSKKRIQKIAASSPLIKEKMGLGYLKKAVLEWRKDLDPGETKQLSSNPVFQDFLNFCKKQFDAPEKTDRTSRRMTAKTT